VEIEGSDGEVTDDKKNVAAVITIRQSTER